MLTGKLSWLNLWDREMSADQVLNLNCRDEGNIVNWNTLSVMGDATFHYENFPCEGKVLGSALFHSVFSSCP